MSVILRALADDLRRRIPRDWIVSHAYPDRINVGQPGPVPRQVDICLDGCHLHLHLIDPGRTRILTVLDLNDPRSLDHLDECLRSRCGVPLGPELR